MQPTTKSLTPIGISDFVPRSISSIQQVLSTLPISVQAPEQYRIRWAITHGGKYLGLDDAIQMRLFPEPDRAHLFMTQERAAAIARELPELGGKWTQLTEYDIVPLYYSIQLSCIASTVCQ